MILVLRDIVIPTDGGSQLFSRLISLAMVPRTEVVIRDENWGLGTNLLVRLCYNRFVRYLRRYVPFSWLFILVFYGLLRAALQRRLLQRFKEQGITGVWCAANDLLPPVGVVVGQGLRCPLHVSITDLPETYLLHESERRFLRKRRPIWLHVARSCDLASEGMRHYLAGEEGGIPRTLITWSSAGVTCQSAGFSVRAQLRTIAFSGSMRFHKELAALLRGLEAFADRQGRRVLLRLFAKRPVRSPFVDWRGYVNEDARLATALAECDAGYSPMGFAERERVLVATSFPGKIATYLAARLPIIAHGPRYATNVGFVESLNVGLALKTLEAERIAETLEQYERDIELRVLHSTNTESVVMQHFAPTVRSDFFLELMA
jgi:hypothetical protein